MKRISIDRRGRRLRDALLAVASATGVVLAVVAAPAVGRAAAGPCTVGYTVNQWTGGFTAAVTLTDNGGAITAWTLTWSFGGNQQVTSAWNATVTQSGKSVSAASLSYNGALASGGSTSFGFQGTYSGANDTPADFALNGQLCNGGPTATPSATTPTSASASATVSASATASASASPSASPTPTSTGGACLSASVFCDDFESQTIAIPSGRWSVYEPNCSGTGTASVTSAQAHSGAKSLAAAGTAGYCNHVFVRDAGDMAAAAPTWYVRFWIRHDTALPTGHVTFLAMNDSAAGNTDLRLGGQNGALVWNRQSDDATLPVQSPAGVAQSVVLPTGAWECVEFSVNRTNGQIYTWYNGSAVPGLTEDGVSTPDVDSQWLSGTGASWRPNLTDLKLGWESYSGGNDDLWFDDVALSNSRIGCS